MAYAGNRESLRSITFASPAAASALLEGCRAEAAPLLEKRAVEGGAEARSLRSHELRTLAECLQTLSRASGKGVPDGILRALYLLHLCLDSIERSRLASAGAVYHTSEPAADVSR
jgi:hypothetical protein